MKFFLLVTLLLSSLVSSIPTTNPRSFTPTTQLERSVLHTDSDSALVGRRIIPREDTDEDEDDAFVPDLALRARDEDDEDEEFVPDEAL